MTTHLTGLRTALHFPPTDQGTSRGKQHEKQELLRLARKCSKTARELFAKLAKLKVDGPNKKRQDIGKIVKAIGKKGSIERIQKQLDEYRKVLDTRVLIGLRSVHCVEVIGG